ncbi:MAG: hypothetical protein JNN15_21320, partial [Blastocatellia bacterium]|nr:hypothetical protein [Blastocatellia bacterium]
MRKFILVIFSLSLLLPMLFSTKVMAEKREPNLPPPGKTVSFYLTKGGRLLESGNFSLAIAYLEASLKAPRKGVKMSVVQLAEKLLASARLYEQARLIREAGQQEAAVEKYLEIMKINPVDPRPLEFIVEIYDILSEQAEKKKDYREAARLYENWVKYAPANDFPKKLLITNLRLAADEAFTSSDVQAAVLYYKKLLELDPTDVQIEKKIQEIEKKQELAEIEKRFQNNVYDQTLTGELTRLSILYPEETKLKDMIRVVQGRREMRQADSLMASYKYHEAFNLYKKASLLLPEEKEKIEQRIEEIQIRTGANYSSDGIAILRGTIQGSVKLSL